jgi:hypothetical protein
MRWRRLKRRAGGGLGLFALAIQLVFSFGHIHPEDVLPPSAFAARRTTLLPPGTNVSTAPAKHRAPNGLPDDDCPICMAMHIAASGLLPVAPSVVLPSEFDRVSRNTVIQKFDLSIRRYIIFQTRAPPFA